MSNVSKDSRGVKLESSKSEPHTVSEQVVESATGEDRPMDDVHPSSPGALVWFTYPVMLIVAILIILAIVGLRYGS